MYERKDSLQGKSPRRANDALDWWDVPILGERVKTNSKIKQQLQTLITSKILCPFKKTKINNKVNIASDKTETKQNKLQVPRNVMGPVHNKA